MSSLCEYKFASYLAHGIFSYENYRQAYRANGVSGGGNAAFAKAAAESTAAAINSRSSGTTVTAWQAYNAINSGSCGASIYYAINGSASQSASAAQAIASKPVAPPPPDPSLADKKKLPDPIKPVETITAYSLYDNKPYQVKESDVGNSAGKLLLNSTPDQTERAIIALGLLVQVQRRSCAMGRKSGKMEA